MYLILESGTTLADVDEDAVRALLPGELFAVLATSADETTYLQCHVRGAEGEVSYDLEFQAGDLSEHYMATDEAITLAAVTEAFVKYLRGDPGWMTDFTWERMDLGPDWP